MIAPTSETYMRGDGKELHFTIPGQDGIHFTFGFRLLDNGQVEVTLPASPVGMSGCLDALQCFRLANLLTTKREVTRA